MAKVRVFKSNKDFIDKMTRENGGKPLKMLGSGMELTLENWERGQLQILKEDQELKKKSKIS